MKGAVLSVEQMRAAEQAAMEAGTSEWDLMQRAGEGAAQWVWQTAGRRSVCVLCGPGNNGGDGYVIAESLRRRGLSVAVVAPAKPRSDTARRAKEAFRGEICEGLLPPADVYVDCLFGYGLSRPIEGVFAELLDQMAQVAGYKIAVDVPSYAESDTGAVLGPALDYDLTIALGAWKRAHFAMPTMAKMGVKRLLDIGLETPENVARVSTAPKIDPPAVDAHKYRRGLLAVVAGEMPGAGLLSAEAGMRSGAGYVKLLGKHAHPDAPADLVIEHTSLDAALSDQRIVSLLIGPGLGRGKEARQKLLSVLDARKPTILDADALTLLEPDDLKRSDPALIGVTPHDGELATLCETFGVEGVTKSERAAALHKRTGMTVLAKGPDIVLVSGSGVRYFEKGSSWLSTAGTGDVLAGIAASRLAVTGNVAQALDEAVWLHHEAARLSGPAFTAGTLARTVHQAMRSFL